MMSKSIDSPITKLPPSVMQGAVFYSKQSGVTSNQPHRLIVMNVDPQGDEIVVLTIISSKVLSTVDRVKKQKEDRATAVDVPKI